MKKTYLLVSVILFVSGGILSHTYRAYIYNNNIFDFHLADTIGNLVAVPSAACLCIALSKKEIKLQNLVLQIALAFCIYECFGLVKLHGVFDWYDIIATIISGVVTYIVLNKIRRHTNI